MSELIGNFIAPAVSTSAATYNQFVPTGVILSAVCPIFYVAEQTYNDTYDMFTDMGLMHGIFKKMLWVDTCNMLPWCKTMKIGRSSTISRNLDKILKYVNNPKRLDKVMTTALDFNPSQRDEVNHMSCSQEKESK